MDLEFYRQQALRVLNLADRADPFTRKGLLALADIHDVKSGNTWRALRPNERPTMLPLTAA